MLKTARYLQLFAVGVILLDAVSSFAAPSVSVTPSGNGLYVVQGQGLTDAAGIDLEISYDRSSLANPRLSPGNLIRGAMTAVNADLPGVVRISVIGTAPITGSGSIATLTFDRIGNAAGKTPSLTGRIVDAAGKSDLARDDRENSPASIAGSTTVDSTPAGAQTAAGSTAQDGPSVTLPQPSSGGKARYPFVAGGTVTVPQGETVQKEREPVQQLEAQETVKELPQVASVPAPEPPKPERSTATTELVPRKMHESVLDRFRSFKSERTMPALMPLFAAYDDAAFKQEPAILIADGNNVAKITLSKIPGDTAPNFAFTAARAISLEKAGGSWIVVARPDAGVLDAAITVLSGGEMRVYPLIVSPQVNVDLDHSGAITELDYQLYLKGGGKGSAQRFDLNGDGRRDYLDDYIFIANYLSSISTAQGKGRENKTASKGK